MRIRASTLLETVAAMAIIGCVLGCAGLIFSNVLAGDTSARRTRARLAIDHAVTRMLTEGRPGEGERMSDGVLIRSAWKSGGKYHREVHLTALSADGNVLLEEDRTLTTTWND
jgi:Tfp pilus assembly protein PilV